MAKRKMPDGDTKPSKGIFRSDYARNKQDLMRLINQIRSTGAAVDLDLPTIVVAGNQSSGKSSVIEAISGIKLPRAAGTCTRVPIEVRLRQEVNEEWKCAVKIRKEVSELGDDISRFLMLQADGEKAEVDFGPLIFEPEEVESTIRRAQLAILNPSVHFENFVTYELPEEEIEQPLGSTKQLAFSRNVVVLEISGPNITDLTLVDLPGIIQNVGKGEDRNNIQLVENLVRSYIARDCLILLVITMKDDIQNQKAVLLANEVDPYGKRTIGVLTKADTLQGREVNLWLNVLKNITEPLLHGYFVTRQPNADELADGIKYDQARLLETNFFAQTPPWNDLATGWKSRLGTSNLTVSLSDQLLNVIREKLPVLIGHINARFDTLKKEIDALGKEPSNDPSSEMNSLINQFTGLVQAQMMGEGTHEAFIQAVIEEHKKYKHQVRATAPIFIPFTSDQIDNDNDGNLAAYVCDVEEIKEGIAESTTPMGEKINLTEVRKHIKESITRELPNNVPFIVKERLILRFTSIWGSLGNELLSTIQPLMEKFLDKDVQAVFGRYQEGMLPAAVVEIVKEQVRILEENTRLQIAKLTTLDAHSYTLNAHYFIDLKSKILATLKDARYPRPQADIENRQEIVNAILAQLTQLGMPGLTEEDLGKLRRTDDFETELEVMAEVRAYWQVAYKRIIDNVPRVIDAEFIIPAAGAIKAALEKGLSIFAEDGAQRCGRFLAESSLRTRQRDELRTRKDRLALAKEAVRRFGSK